MENKCPLCNVIEREPQNVLWTDGEIALVRHKNMKGHKERLMILKIEHGTSPPKFIPEYIYEAIKMAFDYTEKAVVMEGKYASIPEHWHLSVSDLEPDSQDFRQVLGTPWVRVLHIKDWVKEKVIYK